MHLTHHQIHLGLIGLKFPASRADILRHARSHGAQPQLCAALEQLPDERFDGVAQISRVLVTEDADDFEH